MQALRGDRYVIRSLTELTKIIFALSKTTASITPSTL